MWPTHDQDFSKKKGKGLEKAVALVKKGRTERFSILA